MANDPYVYPGTDVLRNRFGVRDAAELSKREARITVARSIELAERPILGVYDFRHLQAFHRHIFGDVYPWAGEIRTVAIAKGDLFALPEHIEPYLSDVLRQLPAEGHLRGLDRNQFVDRLSHYLAEINSVHPFREGNGRTQRAFLQQLAADGGYHLDWTKLDPARNIEASQAAHRGDEHAMRDMLYGLTMDREQRDVSDLRDAASPRGRRSADGPSAQAAREAVPRSRDPRRGQRP